MENQSGPLEYLLSRNYNYTRLLTILHRHWLSHARDRSCLILKMIEESCLISLTEVKEIPFSLQHKVHLIIRLCRVRHSLRFDISRLPAHLGLKASHLHTRQSTRPRASKFHRGDIKFDIKFSDWRFAARGGANGSRIFRPPGLKRSRMNFC